LQIFLFVKEIFFKKGTEKDRKNRTRREIFFTTGLGKLAEEWEFFLQRKGTEGRKRKGDGREGKKTEM